MTFPEGAPATVTLHRYPSLADANTFVTPFVNYVYVDDAESAPLSVVLGR